MPQPLDGFHLADPIFVDANIVATDDEDLWHIPGVTAWTP
jgi:hypothetical protein